MPFLLKANLTIHIRMLGTFVFRRTHATGVNVRYISLKTHDISHKIL